MVKFEFSAQQALDLYESLAAFKKLLMFHPELVDDCSRSCEMLDEQLEMLQAQHNEIELVKQAILEPPQ